MNFLSDCNDMTWYNPNVIDWFFVFVGVVLTITSACKYSAIFGKYSSLNFCEKNLIRDRGNFPIRAMKICSLSMIASAIYTLIMFHWVLNSMSFFRFCKFHLLWSGGEFAFSMIVMIVVVYIYDSAKNSMEIRMDEEFIKKYCDLDRCKIKHCCELHAKIKKKGEKEKVENLCMHDGKERVGEHPALS